MNLKEQAAVHALQYVQNGMRLGLGTGSTTRCFVAALGKRWQAGVLRDLVCVATSTETAILASELGLPLASLEELSRDGQPPVLDLAVDGADEVDPQLDLIKGLGKALLREKFIEVHARRFVVIVDESKLVSRLGRGPLPVEIIPFEAEVTIRWLQSLGCRAELWRAGDDIPYETDNAHWLARCWFPEGIADARALERLLADRPGVVDHGLFLGMASEVVVAGESGIRVLQRPVSLV
jgi:ribose 5-phosphate isomerase A